MAYHQLSEKENENINIGLINTAIEERRCNESEGLTSETNPTIIGSYTPQLLIDDKPGNRPRLNTVQRVRTYIAML